MWLVEMLHCQYHQPQIPKYVQDPERNLGLSPSQIHQDHATQCQEECCDGQEECHDGQEVCCDGLELEWDHGKFWAVGDYHCCTLLGKPDSTKCGLPSCPNDNPQLPRTSHDPDRKSTRLNSSHANISYPLFCL